MQEFLRLKRLPPYVFNITGEMKAAARARGEDIIDFGMGNPDGATPKHIVDKMIEAAGKTATHRYSLSKGIPRLRKAICNWSVSYTHLDVYKRQALCLAVFLTLHAQIAPAAQELLRQILGVAAQAQPACRESPQIVAAEVGHGTQRGNQVRSFGAHFSEPGLEMQLFLYQLFQLGLFGRQFHRSPAQNPFQRKFELGHRRVPIRATRPVFPGAPKSRAAGRSYARLA